MPSLLQAAFVTASPYGWMVKRWRRYGDVFSSRFPIFGRVVYVADPALVKEVFRGDPATFHAGEANTLALGDALGEHSLLTLDEDRHMSQRKLLLPPFHGERMKAYGGLMAEAAEAEIAAWPAGQVVATRPAMQRITLEIVMRAIFGITDTRAMGRMRAALTSMLDWTTKPSRLMLLVAAGPKGIPRIPEYRAVMAELDAVIAEAIAGGRAACDVAERGDVLSMLLGARHEDDGSPMTDAELRDELVTLLVAGHETTATALSWALERLARHPEAWARLRSGDEPYLDAVIKETLRLRPVLPIVLRRLKAPLEIGGWELPEGVSAVP